jgi:hypothetical protein
LSIHLFVRLPPDNGKFLPSELIYIIHALNPNLNRPHHVWYWIIILI